MVYNHMYMAVAFAGDPREAYVALRERVCLWDVGAERQTELRGPDAVAFANFLCTRDLRGLAVGRCRFTMLCDDAGTIMTEPIVLRPSEHTVWISHGDVDLTLWASALARAGGYDVEVGEPDVAPIQVQGPRSRELLSALTPDVAELAYYRCVETTIPASGASSRAPVGAGTWATRSSRSAARARWTSGTRSSAPASRTGSWSPGPTSTARSSRRSPTPTTTSTRA